MMKARNIIFKGLLTVVAGLFISGCINAFDPPSLHEGNPAFNGLQIIIGDDASARTAFPRTDFSKYVLSFAKSGGGTREDIIIQGTSTTRVDGLSAGTWAITVKAYMEIDTDSSSETPAVEFEVLSRTQSFVIGGGPQTISFSLSAADADKTSGQGYLGYTIAFPDDKVDEGTLTIKTIAGTVIDSPVDLVATGAVDSGVKTAKAKIQLDSGYYVVSSVLKNDYHQAGRVEVVHIYKGAETLLGDESGWTFTAEDFVDYITISGTVTNPEAFSGTGMSTNELWVELHRSLPNTDSYKNLQPITSVKVEAGIWSATTAAFSPARDVYFVLAQKNDFGWVYYLPSVTAPTSAAAANISGKALTKGAPLGTSYISSATASNKTIGGSTYLSMTPQDATITLTNAYFVATPAEYPVSSTITNLPAGLTAKVKTTIPAGSSTITVTISGTPLQTSSAAVAITLAANSLLGVPFDLTVTSNPNAKFAITPGTPPAGKSISVTDIPIEEAAGMYYQLVLLENILSESDFANPVALAMGQITAATITAPLYAYSGAEEDPLGDAWGAGGNYHVLLLPYSDNTYSEASREGMFVTLEKVSFTTATTSLSFEDFTQMGGESYEKAIYLEHNDVVGTAGEDIFLGNNSSVHVSVFAQGGYSFTGITNFGYYTYDPSYTYHPGQNLDSFFTNLPAGLHASADQLDYWGDNRQVLRIRFYGTPTSSYTGDIAMVIPTDNILDEGIPPTVGVPVTYEDDLNKARFLIGTSSKIALSGRVELLVDGDPFSVVLPGGGTPYTDYGHIAFYTDPLMSSWTSSFDYIYIQPDGTWTASNVPDSLKGVKIYAQFVMPVASGAETYHPQVMYCIETTLTNENVQEWDMLQQEFFSINGHVNITKNTSDQLLDDSKYSFTINAIHESQGGWEFVAGNIGKSNGDWQVVVPATGPWPLTFEMQIHEAGIGDSIYYEDINTVNFAGSSVTGLTYSCNFITLSGNVAMTKGGTSIDPAAMVLRARSGYDDLGVTYSVEDDGDWTMLVLGGTSRTVNIIVYFKGDTEFGNLNGKTIWTGSVANAAIPGINFTGTYE